MSKVFKSAADYFNIYGELIEESEEFADVKLEDHVDEFVPIKPSWIGRYSGQMHFDLPSGTEVSFYKQPNMVYADILYSGGVRTILFKCRQKKNLKKFINEVLYLSSCKTSDIHPDYRA